MSEILTTGITRYIAQENVSKTFKILGWENRIGIEIGATNLVNWNKQVRKWEKDVATP